jgi:hypothetical protein
VGFQTVEVPLFGQASRALYFLGDNDVLLVRPHIDRAEYGYASFDGMNQLLVLVLQTLQFPQVAGRIPRRFVNFIGQSQELGPQDIRVLHGLFSRASKLGAENQGTGAP